MEWEKEERGREKKEREKEMGREKKRDEEGGKKEGRRKEERGTEGEQGGRESNNWQMFAGIELLHPG